MTLSLRWPACVVTVVFTSGCPETGAPGPSDSGSVKTAPATASAKSSAPTTASTPTATTASATVSASTGEQEVVTVVTKDAGVAGVGFTVKGLAGQGWTVTTSPAEGDLLRLSGPPGGPLGLRIVAYDEKNGDDEKVLRLVENPTKLRSGRPEKVELAGEPRAAQSFRTGEGFATTAHCLIRLPAKPGAKTGILFLAHSGLSENDEPTCAKALDAPALKPIVASFRLVP